MRLPTGDAPVPHKIHGSSRFSQYFRGCIGALDGTHIPVHVPEARRTAYRNRKSYLSQNVLAACDFDLKFIYVLSGWEGSAADSRVYEDARAADFIVPNGRYYLGDAGYANSTSLLVPYRSTRYHLKEWGQGRHRYARILICAFPLIWLYTRPQNHKELFNYRHSQLRNHVERIFGLFKRRFRVLMLAQEYPLGFQAQLVPALPSCTISSEFTTLEISPKTKTFQMAFNLILTTINTHSAQKFVMQQRDSEKNFLSKCGTITRTVTTVKHSVLMYV